MTRPRVAVLFGGRSTEHAISCVSAGSVLAALDRDRWDVVPVGITTDGRWVLADDEPGKLAIREGALPSVDDAGPSLRPAADPGADFLSVLEPGTAARSLGRIDVVLPLLHGPYGEDGTVQGLLELAGVPYVGSGVLASSAAMDKAVMKALLAQAGLPVGPYRVVEDRDWRDDPAACLAAIAELSLPVFVKPARGGSSVGISRVTSLDDVPAAIEAARVHDPKVVVEQGVPGRELECGVLDDPDHGLRASVPAEIRLVGDHAFYDFEAKYLDDRTELDVPADLEDGTTRRLQDVAVRAFRALGCEGLARVDFFLGADDVLTVNEVNTMPGFTPTSMFPRMWAAAGVAYPDLVDTLLRAALARPVGLR